MSFTQIKGQQRAVRILQKEIATSSFPGAYLFIGPAGVGKTFTALNFAKALNCRRGGRDSCDKCSSCLKIDHLNHPDVRVIKPEGDSLKIDQVRILKRSTAYKLYEGKKRVWIIEEAHKFTLEAANSALKIMEEPPPDTVFILISETKREILPTILSRCEIVRFFPLSPEKIEEIIGNYLPPNSPKVPLIANLSRGSIKKALLLIKEENVLKERENIIDKLSKNIPIDEIFDLVASWKNFNEEQLEEILNMILFWFRDLLLLKEDGDAELINIDKIKKLKEEEKKYPYFTIQDAINTIETTRSYLKSNVKPKLALENMWLKLKYSGRSDNN
ncbi:MAG: DNA polymerase III subunit delta' [Candidatus Aerophobetes bacterium]|nr:DNA polymerase III subunit delta' [Candidatus Aerophobetes bacterium]